MKNIDVIFTEAYEAFMFCGTETEEDELVLQLHETIEDARAEATQYRGNDS